MVRDDWRYKLNEFLEIMVVIGGYAGHVMVWIGMMCGCIMFYYIVCKIVLTVSCISLSGS